MREQLPDAAGAASTGDGNSGPLYIITLSSSTAPIPLEVPSIPELAGLAVFRSRRVEDGRDRFRLHVGYFDSVAAADAVLPHVRTHFPAAWAGPAPTYGMGSLDDTSVTQFKFIKAPNTLHRDAAPAPAPAVSAAPVRTPAPPPVRAKAAPSTPPSKRPAPAARATSAPRNESRAVPPRLAKAMAAANPASPTARTNELRTRPANAPALARSGGAPLAPRQVLSLLESPPPPRTAHLMPPRERAAVIGAIQHFAVQLIWSMDPLNLAEVPKLAIFDAYTLYKVQVDRAGRRWYGLRLGFFADPVSARQVALYARSDFSAAAVVPVSDRECDRAAQAAITDMPTLAPPKKPEPSLELIDDPQPRGSAPRAPARKPPVRRSEAARSERAPAARPVVPRIAQPMAPGKNAGPAKAGKRPTSLAESTHELEKEMDLVPSFEATPDDVNDSGVRHLAVRIVKKNSGLRRLFARSPRRS